MVALDVRLFGELDIRWAGGDAVCLTTPRIQELFCYLVLKRNRAHPREALFDLFWSNSAPAQARRNLRQALWQLQSLVNPAESGPEARLIRANAASVQFNPDTALAFDVATFEQAFTLAKGVPGDRMNREQSEALQTAVELYRGDLLEGWYQDWCLIERERLQNMYLAMLDKLMCFCEAHQTYDNGIGYGERALQYDRANERAHGRIMRLHYLAGNRSAALHQYEQCVAALEEELGVAPSERTTELYRQIRTDTPRIHLRTAGIAPPDLGHLAGNSLLTGALDRLRQLCAAVGTIQAQLQQDIQAIEHIITEAQNSSPR